GVEVPGRHAIPPEAFPSYDWAERTTENMIGPARSVAEPRKRTGSDRGGRTKSLFRVPDRTGSFVVGGAVRRSSRPVQDFCGPVEGATVARYRPPQPQTPHG